MYKAKVSESSRELTAKEKIFKILLALYEHESSLWKT